ncbi:type VI secretion system baseplate subunit TssG [bacterium]|nr:type VI secretion system baseplate subunit TssG [bacterium]
MSMRAPANTQPRDRSPRSSLSPLRRTEASVEERLLVEGHRFDFFQAVRLLEILSPGRRGLGDQLSPRQEPIRFRGSYSLGYPETTIVDLRKTDDESMPPEMVVSFLGFMGQQGLLPTHTTEWLIRLEREGSHEERYAFRSWLSLFEHRLVSLFYRAWKKYRFPANYVTGPTEEETDPFTSMLLSLVGLGTPALRDNLRVLAPVASREDVHATPLASINDLGMLRYAGLFLARSRCASGLRSLLSDYFDVPVEVEQFQGQWLALEPEQQTAIGDEGFNNALGRNAVVGDRVFSVESKFRVRIGPLPFNRFEEFLPDPTPEPIRKTMFLVGRLIHFYVGMDDDFDVQLVLESKSVPECQLNDGVGCGPRLGWNTWALASPYTRDADDAVFSDRTLML